MSKTRCDFEIIKGECFISRCDKPDKKYKLTRIVGLDYARRCLGSKTIDRSLKNILTDSDIVSVYLGNHTKILSLKLIIRALKNILKEDSYFFSRVRVTIRFKGFWIWRKCEIEITEWK